MKFFENGNEMACSDELEGPVGMNMSRDQLA